MKLKADRSLVRFKARLITKGYNQKYGIDYDKTFSPVVKMTTIRCILVFVAFEKWIVYQLDVKCVDNPQGNLKKKSLYGL